MLTVPHPEGVGVPTRPYLFYNVNHDTLGFEVIQRRADMVYEESDSDFVVNTEFPETSEQRLLTIAVEMAAYLTELEQKYG